VQTTNPIGSVTSYTYDGANNQTTVTDPDGNVTTPTIRSIG
jgi:YD repeat-containing protein